MIQAVLKLHPKLSFLFIYLFCIPTMNKGQENKTRETPGAVTGMCRCARKRWPSNLSAGDNDNGG